MAEPRPALGSRWRGAAVGNLYEVATIEGERATLRAVELSADCVRELRVFAEDNRRDPDAEVAAFLAHPMTVDLLWFRRSGAREVRS